MLLGCFIVIFTKLNLPWWLSSLAGAAVYLATIDPDRVPEADHADVATHAEKATHADEADALTEQLEEVL